MAKKKTSNKLKEIVTIPETELFSPESKLTELALSHKTGTVMFFLGMILIGIISFRFIPVSLFPETAYPGLTIETEYFGVGPEKIEEILTKPIEESVSTLGGIEQIFSTSEEGKSKVHVQFDPKVDLDSKSLEIRDKVEQVSYMFPRETQKPVILHYDPTQKPVFIITPKSESLGIMDIREISDREIKKLIEGIPGVSEVIVAGGKPREILIACDSQKMSRYNIRMDLLLQILQEANYNDTSGEINEGTNQIPVYVKGRLKNLKQIESLALRSDPSGKLIRIEDVATVSYSYREESTAARINGQNTVSIYVYRAGTSNLLDVSQKLRKELKNAETESLRFEITYDQAETVQGAITNFIIAGLAGILFYCLGSFLLFKELISSVKNVALLILQFFLCSVFLYFSGIDYNLITIAGVILSMGCGFTVYIICRLFNTPESKLEGINFTKGEILTTILLVGGVFLPISFATKELRTVYGGLGFVLVSGFLISFLLSLTLVPIFDNRFHFENLEASIYRANFLSEFIFDIQNKISKKSVYLIEYFRSRPQIFLFSYIGICAFSVLVYSCSKHEFVNKIEEKQLIGNVEFPSGTSFTRINQTTERIENQLSKLEGIKEINSRVEIGRSTIVVKFHDSVSDPEEIGKELETMIGDIKPAFVYFSGSNDEALLKEITIDVIGDDLLKLDELTREASSAAQSLIPKVRHVLLRYKPPRDEVRILIDKDKSESLGVTSEEIGKLIRYGVQGGVATKFIEEGREVDVRIQYESEFRNSFSDIKDYRITTTEGKSIPLMEVATILRDSTPVRIYRKNKRRVLSFSLRISDLSLSEILSKLEKLKEVKLPDQYRIEFSEHLEKVIANQKRMNAILSFSVLILFMILASYLESLKKPFLFLSVLPVPIACIVLVFYAFDLPLTVSIYIGMILISSFALLQTFLLNKELSNYKESLGPFDESGPLSPEIQKIISRHIERFFQLWLLVGLFYFPQIFVFGTGSALLKSISLTLVLGLTGVCLFVPVTFAIFYLYSDTLKKTALSLFLNVRHYLKTKIEETIRS